MVAVFTTLAAGGHQRAHRHNAAAITLVIAGDGVHMDVDGTRSDFSPWLVMVTPPRSEEHTSELQSLMRLSYAVFCLKKKKTQHNYKTRQPDTVKQSQHISIIIATCNTQ